MARSREDYSTDVAEECKRTACVYVWSDGYDPRPCAVLVQLLVKACEQSKSPGINIDLGNASFVRLYISSQCKRWTYERSNPCWWGLGPIFREVKIRSIGGDSTLATRLLIRHDSKSCNCYTTALLVINQAQLGWTHQEGFFCKRIEEHKQERINTQSEIADMDEAKIKMGFKLWSQKD